MALLLDLVGLTDHADQRPGELSGGSSASRSHAHWRTPRGCSSRTKPTGQLDSATGVAIMGLLRAVVEHERTTALVATHDPVMMALADRVVRLQDGVLVEDEPQGRGRAACASRVLAVLLRPRCPPAFR